MKVKRALISVSDKTGLINFARQLTELGVEIISTGGTAKAIAAENIPVTPISDVTGFPEILQGRVKTLHPKVHGGILADRAKEEHMSQLEKHGIDPIDLVVVNLYPFEETIKKEDITEAQAIEQIDIGGPTMIRAAAKNSASVAVVVDPDDYSAIIREMKESGEISLQTRKKLAQKAFAHTGQYDVAIAQYFSDEDVDFPSTFKLKFEKIQNLRYGENPHQRAAYYKEIDAPRHSLVYAKQLHGKELSFNNILDLNSAWTIAHEFTVPAAVIIKHNNSCGVALNENIAHAYEYARDCDPVSAFGGVIGVNKIVTVELANLIAATFIEAIIAPSYQNEAVEILSKKAGIRLMEMGEERAPHRGEKDIKRVEGGVLVQDMNSMHEERENMKCVTKRIPSDKEWGDLLFAWRVAKHVKSNAIVFAKDLRTVGVGAGQMSRVDSSRIASWKAGDKAKGSVMASDAFFPFRDALDTAGESGITAVIQPGGATKDEEVIAAADEHGIAMVFTGFRHFKH